MKTRIFAFCFAALAAVSCSTAFAQGSSSSDAPFVPSGKLWMQMFMDYDYNLSADTASVSGGKVGAPQGKTYYANNSGVLSSPNTKYFSQFDFRRFYLGYDYNMSKDVSAQLLLSHETGNIVTNTVLTSVATIKNSAGQDSSVLTTKTAASTPTTGSGDILLDGNYGFFLKNANIQFKNWVPMSTVIVGQQGTAAFGFSEMIWGYRSIEKTIADMRSLAQSSDLGIQVKGNFDDAKAYGYSVMIGNGNSAKEATNKFKRVMLDVNGMFLDKHIGVDVYYDIQGAGNDSTNTTLKATAGYMSDMVSVGVEYVTRTVGKESTVTALGDVDQTGLSVYARASLIDKKLLIFARYDMFDPDSKATSSTITSATPWAVAADWKENFIVAGLDWQPSSDVNAHVMPNIWVDTYKDKSSLNIDRQGIVVGRMTFAYKF